MLGIGCPGGVPRPKRRLDMTVHLLSFLICPNLVMVPLPSLPYIVVQSINQYQAAEATWFKVALGQVTGIDRRAEGLVGVSKGALVMLLVCTQQSSHQNQLSS